MLHRHRAVVGPQPGQSQDSQGQGLSEGYGLQLTRQGNLFVSCSARPRAYLDLAPGVGLSIHC